MLDLIFPFPISVNSMYSNHGRRRIKSKRYRLWRAKALEAITEQYYDSLLDYDIKLIIALSPPCKRRRDLDNHAKGIQDALTGTVIVDDSQIKDLNLYWLEKCKGGYAKIIIDSYKTTIDRKIKRD